MALTVDQLNIQITADSQKATRALTSLIKKLEQLKATMNGTGVSNITIANSFNKTTNSVKKTDEATKKYDSTIKKTNKSSRGLLDSLTLTIVKWRTLFGVFNSAARVMGDWFKESNDYIETLNLFRVTMGDATEEALRFSEKVSDAMGIDPAEWMQNQGVFKNLVSGFGVAEESANKMSQNLTQLSYDMASFFNTDVETAFDKLSSAMSGQVKGLREFGIDTTVATLQEYALSKGIETKVRSMTQAEKSLLRYNYIMEQSRDLDIWNDMARTIVTPANALRILNAQLTQMKRALGNIISVLVAKFIPYIQAMVSIITDAANALAKFFGFELPEVDYSGLGSGFADEMEEGFEDASGAAKKLKKQLMGFDELNILSSPDKDSGSGGSGGASGGLGNMELLEYDFLKGLDTSKADEIKDKMKGILKIAGMVGVVIAGWSLGTLLSNLATASIRTKTLKEAMALLGKKLTLTAGVTLAVTGIVLETKGIISTFKEGLNGINFTEILGGGGTIVAGGALIGKFFGKALLGGGIGAIVAGIPMFVTGVYDAIVGGMDLLNALLVPAGSTMAGAGVGAIIGSLGGPIGAGVGALIGLAVGLVTDGIILITQKGGEIVKWFDGVRSKFDGWASDLRGKISRFFSGIVADIAPFSPSIAKFFEEIGIAVMTVFDTVKLKIDRFLTNCRNVVDVLHKLFNGDFAGTWASFKKLISDGFKSIGNEGVIFVNGMIAKIESFVNFLIRGVNKLISGLNKISFDVPDWVPNIGGKKLGFSIKTISEVSLGRVPSFAQGGFPSVGEMFIAREAGPELVGSIGRKTAVANNDQIVSGIEAGVYRAMVAANSGNGGGSQTIRIINEIDGDIVGEKVIQYHNGKVMQTGASPLLV
jgi:hypothetical protein